MSRSRVPSELLLKIEDLSITAGPHRLTDGVSLKIGRGEILCLVGASGSGKSLTALSIPGLLPPGLRADRGRVAIGGEDVLHWPEHRMRRLRAERVGMVFQEPMTALNPVMTCGAQIEEVLTIHRRREKARTLEVLREVGLADPRRVAGVYPHELSGGERQRVMIAQALALRPALLIADEPTTALDVTTQAGILALIRDLAETHGMGILFVTHDFGVVSEIADRVAVMDAGRIVEADRTQAVLKRPRERMTRALLAAVPALAPPASRPKLEAATVARVENLSKTYGARGFLRRSKPVQALCDVSLDLCRAEILGIVGESGSGKSTLARCLARLERPDVGTILINGTDIARLSERALKPFRKRIQTVFQDPYRSLNPRRTVAQSIIEGPMNFGATRTEALAEARRLIDLVRLSPDVLDRLPGALSGGQRQRVSIARSVAMEPDILIADEAVSALDVVVQAEVLDCLRDLRDRLGLATLFVTHDLAVAAQLCDRIAVMHRGRIVETGTAHAILNAPGHGYTKTLLASVPCRDRTHTIIRRSL